MIAVTVYRTGNDWRTKPASTLAAEITAPVGLLETRLTTAFQEAVGRGADLHELGACYSKMNNEFVVNLRDALHDGDLVQVQVLTAIAAGQLEWSAATVQALAATIEAHTLTLIERVAAEQGQEAPAIDAAAVAAALGTAGFAWDGNEWGRNGN